MPKPDINLRTEDLNRILADKSGVFSREETKSFLKLKVKNTLNVTDSLEASLPERPQPASHSDLRENFRAFAKETFDENLNTGLYMRIKDLRDKLDEFESEKGVDGAGLTHVHIGFGLRKARKDATGKEDWNCLHLVMQGADPSDVPGEQPRRVSKNKYSTYDGDENNYMGPKPGCPPFGEPGDE